MVYEFIPLIGGKKFMKKLNVTLFFSVVLLILGGCSEFTGIRQPLYDGQTVEENEEAIAVYHETGEIIGEEKEYYFRYPRSEEHTSELQSRGHLVCRLLLEKKDI